jgi:hypothetical protein
MEDPIEKLHKLDRLTDVVYCHIQNYEFERNANRKKKPPLGTLSDVDSWSK